MSQKRRYKWLGTSNSALVEATPGLTDPMQILPPLVNANVQSEVLVERVLLWWNIRRQLTTILSELAFIVVVQKFDGIGGLLQVLSLLTSDPIELGNKGIMSCGRLPVPGNIDNGFAGGVQVGK